MLLVEYADNIEFMLNADIAEEYESRVFLGYSNIFRKNTDFFQRC